MLGHQTPNNLTRLHDVANTRVKTNVSNICIFQVSSTVFRIFPTLSVPMVTFTTFQGLENFYLRLKDVPYSARMCSNPEPISGLDELVTRIGDEMRTLCGLLDSEPKMCVCVRGYRKLLQSLTLISTLCVIANIAIRQKVRDET